MFDYQVPPTVQTPEKREDEVSMPPYDTETQSLIDGAYIHLFYILGLVPHYLKQGHNLCLSEYTK